MHVKIFQGFSKSPLFKNLLKEPKLSQFKPQQQFGFAQV
jgi:hypothetical protein